MHHLGSPLFRAEVLRHLGRVIAALDSPVVLAPGSLTVTPHIAARWKEAALTSEANFYMWWYAVFPSQDDLTAWGLPAPLDCTDPAWLRRVGAARAIANVLYRAVLQFRRPIPSLPAVPCRLPAQESG